MRQTILIILILLTGKVTLAQEVDTTITLTNTVLEVRVVADSLRIPWDMVWGPDGRIWFTERKGTVKRLDLETGVVDSIYHINDVFTSTENSGLHAMTLHPNFPMPAHVFVHYTYGLYSSRVERYTYDVSTNTLIEPTVIIPFLNGNSSHNGSRMQWDADGKLLFSIGDAYVYLAFPQNVSHNNGKVLRMNPDGSAPSDNPISGSLVWSWGHRNPQGMVLANNGKLYLSEHGPDTDDELNLVEPGRNYGWPYVRGFCDPETTYFDSISEVQFCMDSNVVEPLKVWTPTQAPCGLEYYDHPSIPEWNNSLLLCFLKVRRMKSLKLDPTGESVVEENDLLNQYYGRLRDVLMAPDGRVFICTSNNDQGPVDYFWDKILELKNADFLVERLEVEFTEDQVVVFPNPSSGSVFVQLPNHLKSIQYQLLDISGKVVRSANPNLEFGGFEIKRSSLPAGVYTLRIGTRNGMVVKRVIFS
ncbi:MAG: glucose/arabinose dehydrogenase [Bacteroidia bacterium]|jgi:glucose/arabinose dehydrogenase